MRILPGVDRTKILAWVSNELSVPHTYVAIQKQHPGFVLPFIVGVQIRKAKIYSEKVYFLFLYIERWLTTNLDISAIILCVLLHKRKETSLLPEIFTISCCETSLRKVNQKTKYKDWYWGQNDLID